VSEAEILMALKPEHFQPLTPPERYRILALVGAKPPPTLAKARYGALKPWLPNPGEAHGRPNSTPNPTD